MVHFKTTFTLFAQITLIINNYISKMIFFYSHLFGYRGSHLRDFLGGDPTIAHRVLRGSTSGFRNRGSKN